MNVEKLSRFTSLAETHRRVLSGYVGRYSLGVGHDQLGNGKPVLVLQVENQPEVEFPRVIELDGEAVTLVVKTGFVPPRSLIGRH